MGQSKAVVKISFRATVMGDSIKMEGNVNKFDMIKQLTSTLSSYKMGNCSLCCSDINLKTI